MFKRTPPAGKIHVYVNKKGEVTHTVRGPAAPAGSPRAVGKPAKPKSKD